MSFLKNKKIVLFVIMLLLHSCTSLKKEIELERKRSNRVEWGMSKDQVRAIMGDVKSSGKTSYGDEYLSWKDVVVIFQNGKVIHKTDGTTPRYSIQVESFAANAPKRKNAIIIPSVKGVSPEGLEFMHVRKTVLPIFKSYGYEVKTENKIDVAIFVNFGVSQPKTETISWDEPVYDYVIPKTYGQSKTQHNIYNQFGQNIGTIDSQTTYGNPYEIIIPQQVYRGSVTKSSTVTTYVRHLVMEAVDYPHYIKYGKIKPFWKIVVLSEGESDDFRKVLPYLVVASQTYVEKDSGTKQKTVIFQDDPRVRQLMQ